MNVCRDDVHDRAPVRQGHVRFSFPTLLRSRVSLSLVSCVFYLPTLLAGLTEVDVLHIALGCRFALDIFTISQQHSPTPVHEPLPHDPELSTF